MSGVFIGGTFAGGCTAEFVIGIDQFAHQRQELIAFFRRERRHQPGLRAERCVFHIAGDPVALLGQIGDPHPAVLFPRFAFDQAALRQPREHVGDICAIDSGIMGKRDLIRAGIVEQGGHHRILHRRDGVIAAFVQKDSDMDLMQPTDKIAGAFPQAR